MLIRQFERDTDMLDDAVADWLGASRAELRSGDLRHREMMRSQLAPDQPMPPGYDASAPGQDAARPDQAVMVARLATSVTLPADAWSLLQDLFGGQAIADAGPPAQYSVAETAALIRFFSGSHERRMERIRRIRAITDAGRLGTA